MRGQQVKKSPDSSERDLQKVFKSDRGEAGEGRRERAGREAHSGDN
jgi:hypothetical protein